MLYTFCIVLVLIASVLLILAVLVQSPKSGMAANFGASNQVIGVRQTTDFLEKATWTIAAMMVVFSILAAHSIASDKETATEQLFEVENNAGAASGDVPSFPAEN